MLSAFLSKNNEALVFKNYQPSPSLAQVQLKTRAYYFR